jgi:hypothetical protein
MTASLRTTFIVTALTEVVGVAQPSTVFLQTFAANWELIQHHEMSGTEHGG